MQKTLADNVFSHNYSMMQTKKEIELWEMFWVTRAYTLKTLGYVKKESYIIIDGRPQSPLLTIIC